MKIYKRWKATKILRKFPETFGPYFENIQSLFQFKNNIKLVFLG